MLWSISMASLNICDPLSTTLKRSGSTVPAVVLSCFVPPNTISYSLRITEKRSQCILKMIKSVILCRYSTEYRQSITERLFRSYWLKNTAAAQTRHNMCWHGGVNLVTSLSSPSLWRRHRHCGSFSIIIVIAGVIRNVNTMLFDSSPLATSFFSQLLLLASLQ